MPHEFNLFASLETKAAFTIDSLGRRWYSHKHPRDSKGRFIETGGIARVGFRGLAKVTRALGGDRVEVEFSNGQRETVPSAQLTMVRRPNGEKPTASRIKVAAEDERREQDPNRGDGEEGDDHGDTYADGIPDEDPDDEDAENDDDSDESEFQPSRKDARKGDGVAIGRPGPDGKPEVTFGRVVEARQGKDGVMRPWKLQMANKRQTTTLLDEKPRSVSLLPAEDVEVDDLLDAERAKGRPLPIAEGYRLALDNTHPHATNRKSDEGVSTATDDEPEPTGSNEGTYTRHDGDLNGEGIRVRLSPSKNLALHRAGPRKYVAYRRSNNPDAPLTIGGERYEELDRHPKNDGDFRANFAGSDEDHGPESEAQASQRRARSFLRDGLAAETPEEVERVGREAQEAGLGDTEVPHQGRRRSVGAILTERMGQMGVDVPARQREQDQEQADEEPQEQTGQEPQAGSASEPGALHRGDRRLTDEEHAEGMRRVLNPTEEEQARRQAALDRNQREAEEYLQRREAREREAQERAEREAQQPESETAPEEPDAPEPEAARKEEVARRGAMYAVEGSKPGTFEVRGKTDTLMGEIRQGRNGSASGTLMGRRGKDTGTDVQDVLDKMYASVNSISVEKAREAPGGKPATDRERAYDRPTTTDEGADRGAGLRGDRGEVLPDVPAEPVREDRGERQGAVLPGDRAAGGGRGGVSDRGQPAGGEQERRQPTGEGAPREHGAREGRGGGPGRAGVPAAGERNRGPRAAQRVEPRDFQPTGQADLAPPDEEGKVAANLAALRTLRKVQAEDRHATPEEQAVLARFAGWGQLPRVFTTGDKKYAAEREELKKLLGPDEYEDAHQNALNAHYTDAKLVDKLWTALRALGFNGGQVLEPGSGAGNFIGRAPKDAHMNGVELNEATAGISKLLYPSANIRNESFADTRIEPGMFDAVIGNVPFGNYPEADRTHNPRNRMVIHDHFINKALTGLKPGGVMAVVTSAGTLNKRDAHARQRMAEQADLLGAVRLPQGAHKAAAGTDVVTDVLLFRKRKPGEAPGDQSWVNSSPAFHADGSPVLGISRNGEKSQQSVNDYFTANPENVLGQVQDGGYNGVKVVGDPDAAPEQLQSRLTAIVGEARQAGRAAEQERVAAPKPKKLAPKKAAQASAAARGELFVEPSARTKRRPKIVGQITHTGTENVPGKRAGAAGSLRHTFTMVDLDGDEVEYVPDGAKSAGSKAPNQADELVALLRMRDVRQDLIDAEKATTEDNDEIRDLRAELNSLYDEYVAKYGPINRVNVTRREVPAPAEGEEPDDDMIEGDDGKWYKETRRNPPMGGIRNDPTWWGLVGLEKDYDQPSNTATKSAAFTKRQIGYRALPTKAEDPDDALAISMETDGRIDLDRIAGLLGIDPSEARSVLGDRVFTDHETGELVLARLYLAGDTRAKVRALRELAAKEPQWEPNLRAMELAVPADKNPTSIHVRLGSAWVPTRYFQQFLHDLTGNREATVQRDQDGEWQVRVGSGGNRNPSIEGGQSMRPPYGHDPDKPLLARWGTRRRSTYDLLETALKQSRPVVKDKDDEGKEFVNRAETEAAKRMQEKLQKEFGRWLWRDGERSEALQTLYNEKFRSYTEVNYVDSEPRTMPGMSDAISLDPHQNDFVTMATEQPAVMAAHEVGVGKTFAAAAAIMEMKRLGQVNKPVWVAPNHLLEQAVREFKLLYPDAKVLAGDTETMGPVGSNNRRRFVAQAAGNDWDVVIMTATAFASLPLSEDAARADLDAKLNDLRSKRDDALEAGKTGQVKKIGEQIKKAEAKFQELEDRLNRDKGGLDFTTAGFDYVVVDEAQYYKNDRVESGIRGLAKENPKAAAVDLRDKLNWLREENARRGRNRVGMFLTGTPVSNSSREFYVMTRFLRPDLLERAGISNFDDFAAQFLEMKEEIEVDVAGRIQLKSREGDLLVNTGELKRMWVQFADEVTADDVGIERPKLKGGQAEKVSEEVSPALGQYVAHLAERRQKVKPSWKPQKGDDTVVAIGTDGLIAAVDLRLLSDAKLQAAGLSREDLTDDDSKVSLVGRSIIDEWRRTKDMTFTVKKGDPTPHPTKGALQLVFADKGIPKEEQHSFYQAMKDYLIRESEGGLTDSEIAFIHDAEGDPVKLGQLMEKARTGEIKVLIGSTAKMGTGLNVQNRLSKLHHVDGSYRPDEIEQRNGRIQRRGNQFGEVSIAYYPLEGSTEGFQWGHVARKDNFLRQFAQADLDATIVGRSDETASESDMLKAISAKNPLLMDKTRVDKLWREAEDDRDAHDAAIEYHSDVVKRGTATVHKWQQDIEKLEQVAQGWVDTSGDKFSMQGFDRYQRTIGNPMTNRKAAGEYLKERVSELLEYAPRHGPGRDEKIGQVGGMTVWARANTDWMNGRVIEFRVQDPDSRDYSPRFVNLDPATIKTNATVDHNTVQRIEGLVGRLPDRANVLRANIRQKQEEVGVSQVESQREFENADEWEALKERREALFELMKLRSSGGKDEDIAYAQMQYDDKTARWQEIRDARVNAGGGFKPAELGAARTSRRKVKQQQVAAQREAATGTAAPRQRTRAADASMDEAGRARTAPPPAAPAEPQETFEADDVAADLADLGVETPEPTPAAAPEAPETDTLGPDREQFTADDVAADLADLGIDADVDPDATAAPDTEPEEAETPAEAFGPEQVAQDLADLGMTPEQAQAEADEIAESERAAAEGGGQPPRTPAAPAAAAEGPEDRPLGEPEVPLSEIVDGDYPLLDGITADDQEEYTARNCGDLAMSLHNATGWPITLVADGFDPDNPPVFPGWVHAGVTTPSGHFLDVNGLHHPGQAIDDWLAMGLEEELGDASVMEVNAAEFQRRGNGAPTDRSDQIAQVVLEHMGQARDPEPSPMPEPTAAAGDQIEVDPENKPGSTEGPDLVDTPALTGELPGQQMIGGVEPELSMILDEEPERRQPEREVEGQTDVFDQAAESEQAAGLPPLPDDATGTVNGGDIRAGMLVYRRTGPDDNPSWDTWAGKPSYVSKVSRQPDGTLYGFLHNESGNGEGTFSIGPDQLDQPRFARVEDAKRERAANKRFRDYPGAQQVGAEPDTYPIRGVNDEYPQGIRAHDVVEGQPVRVEDYSNAGTGGNAAAYNRLTADDSQRPYAAGRAANVQHGTGRHGDVTTFDVVDEDGNKVGQFDGFGDRWIGSQPVSMEQADVERDLADLGGDEGLTARVVDRGTGGVEEREPGTGGPYDADGMGPVTRGRGFVSVDTALGEATVAKRPNGDGWNITYPGDMSPADEAGTLREGLAALRGYVASNYDPEADARTAALREENDRTERELVEAGVLPADEPIEEGGPTPPALTDAERAAAGQGARDAFAQTPIGVALDGDGTRLQDLDPERGVGDVYDPDGNKVGQITSRTNEDGETVWSGQRNDADGPVTEETASHEQAARDLAAAADGPEPDPEPQPEPMSPESQTRMADDAPVEAEEAYEPKTQARLEGEKFPLTGQQQRIADAVVADRQDTLVTAKAGTGKTSTLEAIARRLKVLHPEDRAAYIAFNKSVQTEAEGRMPDNVEPRTGHSIAFVWAGKDYTDARFRNPKALRQPDEIARHLGVARPLDTGHGETLSRTEQAQAAIKAVDTYSNSADDEIGVQHLPERWQNLPPEATRALLDLANKAWDDIRGKTGRLNVTNDHIRKMWALARPDLSKPGSGLRKPATVLFLDEAQDTPPVLAKVVADQTIQKVIVGDADQAIYGFTGATDYLSTAKADVSLPLTKSWRFGPEVADMGNRFLQVLGSNERVEGGGPASNIVNDMQGADAILVRSNGGMIGEIVRELGEGRTVGVPKGTKQDLRSLIESARYLRGEGPAPRTMHDDLAPYRTWGEVMEAVEEGDDQKLAMLTRLVGDYGLDELDRIVGQIQELGDGGGLDGLRFSNDEHGLVASGNTFKHKDALKQAGFRWMDVPGQRKKDGTPLKAWTATGSDTEREAKLARVRESAAGGPPPDVVVSTAHKAKGLEWARVRIGDDFRGPQEDKATGEKIMPSPEELRLAYVAVTRAEKELDPGSLAWVMPYSDANGGIPGQRRGEQAMEPEQVAADLADLGVEAPEAPAAPATAPEQPAAGGYAPVPRGQHGGADVARWTELAATPEGVEADGHADAEGYYVRNLTDEGAELVGPDGTVKGTISRGADRKGNSQWIANFNGREVGRSGEDSPFYAARTLANRAYREDQRAAAQEAAGERVPTGAGGPEGWPDTVTPTRWDDVEPGMILRDRDNTGHMYGSTMRVDEVRSSPDGLEVDYTLIEPSGRENGGGTLTPPRNFYIGVETPAAAPEPEAAPETPPAPEAPEAVAPFDGPDVRDLPAWTKDADGARWLRDEETGVALRVLKDTELGMGGYNIERYGPDGTLLNRGNTSSLKDAQRYAEKDFIELRGEAASTTRFPDAATLPEGEWIDRGGVRAFRVGDAVGLVWPSSLDTDYWEGRVLNTRAPDAESNGLHLRGWDESLHRMHGRGTHTALEERIAELAPHMAAVADAWNAYDLNRLNYRGGRADDRMHASELEAEATDLQDALDRLEGADATLLHQRVSERLNTVNNELDAKGRQRRDGQPHYTEISDEELAAELERWSDRSEYAYYQDLLHERDRRRAGGTYGPYEDEHDDASGIEFTDRRPKETREGESDKEREERWKREREEDDATLRRELDESARDREERDERRRDRRRRRRRGQRGLQTPPEPDQGDLPFLPQPPDQTPPPATAVVGSPPAGGGADEGRGPASGPEGTPGAPDTGRSAPDLRARDGRPLTDLTDDELTDERNASAGILELAADSNMPVAATLRDRLDAIDRMLADRGVGEPTGPEEFETAGPVQDDLPEPEQVFTFADEPGKRYSMWEDHFSGIYATDLDTGERVNLPASRFENGWFPEDADTATPETPEEPEGYEASAQRRVDELADQANLNASDLLDRLSEGAEYDEEAYSNARDDLDQAVGYSTQGLHGDAADAADRAVRSAQDDGLPSEDADDLRALAEELRAVADADAARRRGEPIEGQGAAEAAEEPEQGVVEDGRDDNLAAANLARARDGRLRRGQRGTTSLFGGVTGNAADTGRQIAQAMQNAARDNRPWYVGPTNQGPRAMDYRPGPNFHHRIDPDGSVWDVPVGWPDPDTGVVEPRRRWPDTDVARLLDTHLRDTEPRRDDEGGPAPGQGTLGGPETGGEGAPAAPGGPETPARAPVGGPEAPRRVETPEGAPESERELAPAGVATATDTRPEPLVNGNLPLEDQTLPATGDDGTYEPEQIAHLADYGQEVLASIDGEWYVGSFSKPETDDDGQPKYEFTSVLTDEPIDVAPEQLDSVAAIDGAEIPGRVTDPTDLRPGTRVTARTTGGKTVAGVLEGVTDDRRAIIRDPLGNEHTTKRGGTVRPIHGAYAPGMEPTQAAFAPKTGIWTDQPDGRTIAGAPGEWLAQIVPDGQGGYTWQVNGYGPLSGQTLTGRADSLEAAKRALDDAIESWTIEHAQALTMPGDDEDARDRRTDDVAQQVRDLYPEQATPDDETVQPPTVPEPVEGMNAAWVDTGSLETGDVARVDGDDGDGNSTTRTGHVLGEPEPVTVHTPGEGARDGNRTPVGAARDGDTTDRGTVLTPAGAVAARAEREAEAGELSDPRSAAESQVLSGAMAEQVPVDANGVGVFPRSVVTDRGGRSGIVTEVGARDVAVRWSDKDRDQRVRPGLLTVNDEGHARPEGWTASGTRVRPGQVVTSDDGQGVVEAVNGDTVTVTTPDGERDLPAADLHVAQTAESGQRETAPVEVTPTSVGDLNAGDVILSPGDDGSLSPWTVNSVEGDGDRVDLELADPATGEVQVLDADRGETVGKVTDAATGQPAATAGAQRSPFDAPTGPEGMDVRPAAPQAPEPYPDGTATSQAVLSPEMRSALLDLGLDVDQTSPFDVQQAAARIRHDLPLSSQQAEALATHLRGLAAEGTGGKPRMLKKIANRAEAASLRANQGDLEPEAVADVSGVPTPTKPADLVEGDTVAIPHGNDVEVGTVTDTTPELGGAVVQVETEAPDGTRSTTAVPAGADVPVLPEAPEQPPQADTDTAVDADRAITEPRAQTRIEEAAEAVTDAALDGAEEVDNLDALSDHVNERLDDRADDDAQRRSGDRIGYSLDGSGVDPEVAAETRRAIEATADEVAADTAAMLRDTLEDAEPLPGEAPSEAAQRWANRMRNAKRETATQDAVDRVYDRQREDTGGGPTGGERRQSERDIRDALRSDLFTLADEIAALGEIESAQALSDVAARLAGRPDPIALQRATRAAAMGRRPSIVRGLYERIKGMFRRAREAFLELVQKMMGTGRKAKRSLRAALRAARNEWKGDEDNEVGDLVDDAARHIARGGDADAPTPEQVPGSFPEQVAAWGDRLPGDLNDFGQAEGTSYDYGPLTRSDVESGQSVTGTPTTGTRLDRAADGGPGATALAHVDAVKGLGTTVDNEVMAIVRSRLPELGDNPAGAIEEGHRLAEEAEQRARANRRERPWARDIRQEVDRMDAEYAQVLGDAALEVLGQVREMGPRGSRRLRIDGRSAKAKDALRWAEQHFPTEWLAAAGPVNVSTGKAGRYDGDGQITVAPIGRDRDYRASALQGLAKHIAASLPGLEAAQWAYHWQRTSEGPTGRRTRRGRNGLASLARLFPGLGLRDRDVAREGDYPAAWLGRESGRDRPLDLMPIVWAELFGGDYYSDDDLRKFMLGLAAYTGRR